jgi:hypothetical protein
MIRFVVTSSIMSVLRKIVKFSRSIMRALWHGLGVPGKFCTRVNETNWYGRSLEWHEESGKVLSRL